MLYARRGKRAHARGRHSGRSVGAAASQANAAISTMARSTASARIRGPPRRTSARLITRSRGSRTPPSQSGLEVKIGKTERILTCSAELTEARDALFLLWFLRGSPLFWYSQAHAREWRNWQTRWA